MGGHAAGEVASQEAVDTVYGMVKRGIGELHELVDPSTKTDARAACRLMESAVQAATYMVFSMAEMDRGKSGMGTTISAMLVLGDYAVTAQVGDSRIYCINGGAVRAAHRRSHAHRLAVEAGAHHPAGSAQVPSQERHHARRGQPRVRPGRHPLRAARPPASASCSAATGCTATCRTRTSRRSSSLGGDCDGERFIALANERGGKDNITAILVEID